MTDKQDDSYWFHVFLGVVTVLAAALLLIGLSGLVIWVWRLALGLA